MTGRHAAEKHGIELPDGLVSLHRQFPPVFRPAFFFPTAGPRRFEGLDFWGEARRSGEKTRQVRV